MDRAERLIRDAKPPAELDDRAEAALARILATPVDAERPRGRRGWVRLGAVAAVLVLGLALATALWTGVQAINAEARASYARAADLVSQNGAPVLSGADGRVTLAEYVALLGVLHGELDRTRHAGDRAQGDDETLLGKLLHQLVQALAFDAA